MNTLFIGIKSNVCRPGGIIPQRTADIVPSSQTCKWTTCYCWSMLTSIKINKTSTPCPCRHHTHSHRKYHKLCARRFKSNLCFSASLECLLGQSGKSLKDCNYVGHAGVKLHFIKICKIWEMQIPHQEEACLTEKCIFIEGLNSVCLDFAYNGATLGFFLCW